jgi:hypothetical protein
MSFINDINRDRFPYPNDDDDAIAPDAAPKSRQPISPDEAARLERQKFGESSLDENRDDQFDAHHADPDEHV